MEKGGEGFLRELGELPERLHRLAWDGAAQGGVLGFRRNMRGLGWNKPMTGL